MHFDWTLSISQVKVLFLLRKRVRSVACINRRYMQMTPNARAMYSLNLNVLQSHIHHFVGCLSVFLIAMSCQMNSRLDRWMDRHVGITFSQLFLIYIHYQVEIDGRQRVSTQRVFIGAGQMCAHPRRSVRRKVVCLSRQPDH